MIFCHRPVLFFATWLFLFCLHWGAGTTSYGLFLKERLGLTPQGMGLYMATEFAVLAITAYWYGRSWYGRLSSLSLLSLALVTSGLGHILMTIPNVGLSLTWRLVHGFGDALIMMEIYTTIARLFHVDRVGGHSSLINLVSVSGSFAGALIFGPLGAAYRVPVAANHLWLHQPVSVTPGILEFEEQSRLDSGHIDGVWKTEAGTLAGLV